MTNYELVRQLRSIVGPRHLLAGQGAADRFCTGFRFGSGPALAVVRPGSLVEQWRVIEACVAAEIIVIMQAANTGLTGGSTPDGIYDRPVVVVSTMRLRGIHLLDEGKQVVCLPGATLYELERTLKPISREPHSVIGSSCIGASVMGGVCNNSGGALIRRGPAYTELALYARVAVDGSLRLVNHLGIALGDQPEEMLERLEHGSFGASDIDRALNRRASDDRYVAHVRDIEAVTPARFNADPRCLFEASGSAGRIVLFAVRLDTFPSEKNTSVFYIGTNCPDELTTLRRTSLANFDALPVAAEYIHRTAFDIAERYGKDMFAAIGLLGTDRLPRLFALKARVDAIGRRLGCGSALGDRLLHQFGKWLPPHLPARMVAFRDRFDHHLIVRTTEVGSDEMRSYLQRRAYSSDSDFFECTSSEAEAAFRHRFVVAGAAARFRAIHDRDIEDLVALDIALPRNVIDWVEKLPVEIQSTMVHRLYYGHFYCHVFHQDYLIKKGHDALAVEHQLLDLLDQRGAQYPAEHNVGHLYCAKPELRAFYRELDPTNQLNPGIGQTSRQRDWESDDAHDCEAT